MNGRTEDHEWKYDSTKGRYYREPKPGYREYATDYIFNGTHIQGRPEPTARTGLICPLRSKGLNADCKNNCVAYTDKGCSIVIGNKGNPKKGKYCPFMNRDCVGVHCSWWGDYGHCIIFKEA